MELKKILIVNRGEIAVRIIRACREMGIVSATIFTDADKNSLHCRMADESYYIGKSPANESYLNIKKIIDLAVKINADAIHPGYGFLSENSEFIKVVEESGIIFIGPTANSVEKMGEKTSARKLMKESGVPIVPGTTEPIHDLMSLKKICSEIGFPVMIKASAGGGGKGMRKIENESQIESSYNSAKSEASKAFGNDDVYIEKFIVNPKHIEVQILGDAHGNYRHLFERECSIQRRNQKIIEEAPSHSIDNNIRTKLTDAAINAAKAVNYLGAGTIEFLMDDKKNYYFLEMNTRLQVEHPVSELITGIDIVKEQINIAAGKKVSFEQNELVIFGNAVECRIYAEDSDNNFSPSTGSIKFYSMPSGPGIRVDSGIDEFSEVPIFYDSMIAKIITHAKTRAEAISRMERALKEIQLLGIKSNVELLTWVMQNKNFRDGKFNINFISEEFLPLISKEWKPEIPDEIYNAASIIAALLKNKDRSLKCEKNIISGDNKWGQL